MNENIKFPFSVSFNPKRNNLWHPYSVLGLGEWCKTIVPDHRNGNKYISNQKEYKIKEGDLLVSSRSLIDWIFSLTKLNLFEDSGSVFSLAGCELSGKKDKGKYFLEHFRKIESFSCIDIGKNKYHFTEETSAEIFLENFCFPFLKEIRRLNILGRSFHLKDRNDLVKWSILFGFIEPSNDKNKGLNSYYYESESIEKLFI